MKKINLLSSVAISLLATTASAAIAVVNQDGENVYDGSFTINGAAAGNVLVVATYRDSGGGAVTDLSFGGNTQTGAIVGNRTSLFYYEVGTTGDYDITASLGGKTSGLYVWELSGVDTSIAPDEMNVYLGNTPTGTQNITTTHDNAFVLSAIGWNVGGAATSAMSIEPAAGNSTITSTDFQHQIAFTAGGFLGGGTGTAGPAGTYDLSWTVNDYATSYADFNNLAYAFTAVPEPGTFALLAVGMATFGLTALRRRK